MKRDFIIHFNFSQSFIYMALEKIYTSQEEKLNILTHGLGFGFAFIGTIILLIKAIDSGSFWQLVSSCIYGFSLIILYLASTLYHASTIPERRRKLNIFDHASIFVLIAGTYTPFLLVTLRGPWGWSLFGIIWAIAIAGIIFKIFYTGRFNKASTIAYVLMGLIILVAIKPLIENLSLAGLYWLIAGGVSYIIGAIFYLQKNMAYHHPIFHVFVLAGSFCHYWAVYFYVLT